MDEFNNLIIVVQVGLQRVDSSVQQLVRNNGQQIVRFYSQKIIKKRELIGMFHSKSFNLSSILHRKGSRIEGVVQTVQKGSVIDKESVEQKRSAIQNLQRQNLQLRTDIQQLKEEVIRLRIERDTQTRAYDELIQQLRTQLAQKDQLLVRCVQTIKSMPNGKFMVEEIKEDQQQYNLTDRESNQRQRDLYQRQQGDNQGYPQMVQHQHQQQVVEYQTPPQVSHLMLESTVGMREKYELTLRQLESLRVQYQSLKQEHQTYKQKARKSLLMTNDVSFTGKSGMRVSFDFGDLTTELQGVQQIAEFTTDSKMVVNQEEISIREERIENLERENFQLQHEIASQSHKLARIFNAAFQYGGMQLLDYLQKEIGLVEGKGL